MWEYFVQCCAIVSRGNRNAPKQFPKAASLCFTYHVTLFVVGKVGVKNERRVEVRRGQSSLARFAKVLGPLRCQHFCESCHNMVIVEVGAMSLRTHTEIRQCT